MLTNALLILTLITLITLILGYGQYFKAGILEAPFGDFESKPNEARGRVL